MAARGSLVPYFTHRRMVPKWIFLVGLGVLSLAVVPAPREWLWVLLGALLFPPFEYVTHRFAFHVDPAKHPRIARTVARQHVEHHKDPDATDYLFNWPPISFSVAAVLFVLYFVLARSLAVAVAMSFGNFAGLVYYEYAHYCAHHVARPWTPWNRWMKKYHLWHHYKNEHFWFGVTQPVGDLVGRTYRRPAEVPMSPTVRDLPTPPDDVRAALAEE